MIADLLAARGVGLNIPPSKLQPQLTEDELAETRRIASVRINVERVIGRLKQYHILDNTPNTMAGIVDRIFYVCRVLTNFSKHFFTLTINKRLLWVGLDRCQKIIKMKNRNIITYMYAYSYLVI